VENHDGEAMFRHACRLGLEGIVWKRAPSNQPSNPHSQG
jgi:ATP-dependent DNA ligase